MTSRMVDARKTSIVGIALTFGIGVYILPDVYAGVPPALQPIFTSALSLATVLVVLLNAVLRIGVARSVSLELAAEADPATAMRDFMERQGGRWGARPEIVERAIAAVNEVLEALAAEGLAERGLRLSATFDELNLDLTVQYHGRPMEFPAVAPSQQEVLEGASGVSHLAGYLARRFADNLKSQCKDGLCEVHLHFDH